MPHSLFESSSDLKQENTFRLFTRTVQRTLHAHEVFFSFSASFCAFLEDPKDNGKQFLVSKAGETHWLRERDQADQFFHRWKQQLQKIAIDFPAIQHLIYASYEVSTLLETLPQPKSEPPSGYLCLHKPAWSLCFDLLTDEVHIASSISEEHLDSLEALVHAEADISRQDFPEKLSPVQSSYLPISYEAAVERVKAYISAGDVFQVNIARFWQMDFPDNALLALYRKLRHFNPAPFSCFVQLDDLTLISSSPERLFSLSSDGYAETRPIAGTRRRSDGDDDLLLQDELLLSDKERAEHIMLVDLERNDLGRVCKAGTIHVNEMMGIEKYATVQHIVSNVRGKLAENRDVVDLFRAMFPGGTITGCPKVRCMEIIHEQEQQARGPYTGSVGYTAWDGSADMNILIRTFWQHQGQLNWAAGAGIVADSDPLDERIETEHKAAGLLRALYTE